MGIQTEVFLEPIEHVYTGISDGRIYTSVSHVLDSVEEDVDWDAVAKNVAGKGKFKDLPTKDAVLSFWKANGKEASDFGTMLHEMQERYAKEFKILPEHKEWEKSIKHIASMFKDYYRTEDEATVYSRRYGIAGTMDKPLFVKKNSNLIDIVDYKTALKASELSFIGKENKYLLDPVSHLQDCKYSRYCLQLSIYGLLAEECAGLKVRSMFIIFIPTDPNVMPYKIPVPYLRLEAIAVLEKFAGISSAVDMTYNNIVEIKSVTEIPNFTMD